MKTENNTKTIKPTFASYKRAVDNAYKIPACNPCVIYSTSRGFYAASSLHPRGSDEVKIGDARHAINGKRFIGSNKNDYQNALQRISSELENTDL
jgi:hypothetical protein